MNEQRDPTGTDFASEQELDQLLESLAAVGARGSVPSEDLDEIEVATREAWQRQLWQSRRRKRRVTTGVVLAAAAAILLAVGIAGRTLKPADDGGPPAVATVELARGIVEISKDDVRTPVALGSPLPAGTVLESGADGGAVVRLAHKGEASDAGDGARLRLAADGRLILHDRNHIELTRGSVYIDTGEAATRTSGDPALRVTTALGSATDIGTRFMVVTDDQTLEVLVRDGQVELSGAHQSAVATAGEKLSLDAGGSLTTSEIPLTGEDWAWTLGLIEPFLVENKTLAQYLSWLSAETGLEYRFENAELEAAVLGVQLHGPAIESSEVFSTIDDMVLGAGLESRIEEGVLWLSESG
jgi:ferric-dicitrate binding protein FerR (iron transport regulator)